MMTLSTAEVPVLTELDPIVGLPVETNLDQLKARRVQEVAFRITKRVLDKYFRAADDAPQPWLFPQLLPITERWLSECVVLKDHAFPQMLLIAEWEHDAADKICRAIQRGTAGEKRIMPILRPYDSTGSTRYVDFTTTKSVYETSEEPPQLRRHGLQVGGQARLRCSTRCPRSAPTSRTRASTSASRTRSRATPPTTCPTSSSATTTASPDPLNLIIEVTGQFRREKAAKAATATDLWVPAVNNHGRLGRWSFLEVTDPWDAANLIRAHVATRRRPEGDDMGLWKAHSRTCLDRQSGQGLRPDQRWFVRFWASKVSVRLAGRHDRRLFLQAVS